MFPLTGAGGGQGYSRKTKASRGGNVSTKFFTNDQANTLLNKFAGIFAHNQDIQFSNALVEVLRR